MKGYKATDLNMQCRGMQYEVGGVYHVDGEIEPCKNGLHFCENLEDVFYYYDRDNSRFFEVEASGVIKNEEDKYVTSDLKIIDELSKVEINRHIYGDGYGYGCIGGPIYGNVHGDGYGYGYSNGFNFGYGNGLECGDFHGNGYGDGYGDGYDIQKILVFV